MANRSLLSALLRLLPIPFVAAATCGAQGGGCGSIVVGDESGGAGGDTGTTTDTSGTSTGGAGGDTGSTSSTSSGTGGAAGGACASAWSHAYGDGQSATDVRIARGAGGEIVLAGSTASGIDFGSGPLAPLGSNDIVLAKLDCDGVLQWSKRLGPSGSQTVGAVALDPQGNIFLAGNFVGQMDLGGGLVTDNASETAYLAKLDPQGNQLWVEVIGTGNASTLAADAAGNVAVGGYGEGSFDFGAGPVSLVTGSFVAKYGPSGTPLFGRVADDTRSESVAFDPAGNLVIAGEIGADTDLGFGTWALTGYWDLFVVKLDAAGAPVWGAHHGTPDGDFAQYAAVDASGAVYVAGWNDGAGGLDVGGGPLPWGMFVFKLDAQGNFVWDAAQTGMASPAVLGLALGGGGDVYVTGAFGTKQDFAGCVLTWNGGADYLIGLDQQTGALTACHRYGGASYMDGSAIHGAVPAGPNRLVVAGTFAGTLDLGNGPMNAAAAPGSNHWDIFAGVVQP